MPTKKRAKRQSTTTSTRRNAGPLQIPQEGFVRERALLVHVPFSKSTLWKMVGLGQFPKPVKLSVRVTAWDVRSVRAWIESQAQRAT